MSNGSPEWVVVLAPRRWIPSRIAGIVTITQSRTADVE
jgi:hypothetical protein